MTVIEGRGVRKHRGHDAGDQRTKELYMCMCLNHRVILTLSAHSVQRRHSKRNDSSF